MIGRITKRQEHSTSCKYYVPGCQLTRTDKYTAKNNVAGNYVNWLEYLVQIIYKKLCGRVKWQVAGTLFNVVKI